MGSLLPNLSRWLYVLAFAALSSSAWLQWAGLQAQAEAARQRDSLTTLEKLYSLLTRYREADETSKPRFARDISGVADGFSIDYRYESVASASQRVKALASFGAKGNPPEVVQERLRIEVRNLAAMAQSLERHAEDSATLYSSINLILIGLGAALCAVWLYISRRQHQQHPAEPQTVIR